jgi:hypothetical protein
VGSLDQGRLLAKSTSDEVTDRDGASRGRAPRNRTCFSVDNRWLTEAARTLAPHVEWHEGVPGLGFELRARTLKVAPSDVIERVMRAPRDFDPDALRGWEPFTPWTQMHISMRTAGR